jgi:hypothetical protein
MCALTSARRSRRSVVMFPRPRMALIVLDRVGATASNRPLGKRRFNRRSIDGQPGYKGRFDRNEIPIVIQPSSSGIEPVGFEAATDCVVSLPKTESCHDRRVTLMRGRTSSKSDLQYIWLLSPSFAAFIWMRRRPCLPARVSRTIHSFWVAGKDASLPRFASALGPRPTSRGSQLSGAIPVPRRMTGAPSLPCTPLDSGLATHANAYATGRYSQLVCS